MKFPKLSAVDFIDCNQRLKNVYKKIQYESLHAQHMQISTNIINALFQ